jgi:peptide/nickel transport system ATP-binding protein
MADLEFRGLCIDYGAGAGRKRVIDALNLVVPNGQIVGLVGESGSGKSTLARAAFGMVPLSAGQICVDGMDVRKRRPIGALQMIFQDPTASLDPRMSIGRSIAEAIRPGLGVSQRDLPGEVGRLLTMVGIDPARAGNLPGAFSGGQRQRVAIARALASRPSVIVADEITSALDVSVQAAMLNLLRSLQATLGLGMLFISHNIAVVRYISDIVAVLHRGRIVEIQPADRLFEDARHPYTRALLEAGRLEHGVGDLQRGG